MLSMKYLVVGVCVALWAGLVMGAEGKKNKAEAGKPAEAPPEVVGFAGTLEGTVTGMKSNGNWVSINVTKADANDKSTAKDPSALVGKELTIKIRFDKKGGEYQANADDATFVKGLKNGDAIKVVVSYAASQKVLTMVAPPEKK
jgi:hypothetical protein